MDNHDSDVELARERLKPFNRVVVRLVLVIVPASRWAKHREDVYDYEARVLGGRYPVPDRINPALVSARPLCRVLKRLRPFDAEDPKHLFDTPLKSALVIFEREIEHVALLTPRFSEAKAPRGDRKPDVEHQPRFSELRPAREQGAALSDEAGDDVSQVGKYLPPQVRGRRYARRLFVIPLRSFRAVRLGPGSPDIGRQVLAVGVASSDRVRHDHGGDLCVREALGDQGIEHRERNSASIFEWVGLAADQLTQRRPAAREQLLRT